jgi:hypothetical protein
MPDPGRILGRSWRLQVGALDLSGLDMSFTVKRSVHSERPGTCELKVHNLSETHRAELTTLRRPVVILSAGYGDAPPLVFRGDARKVTVVRDAPTWTCAVTAGDGEYAIRTARASVSFSEGATLVDAVRSLARSLGVGVGNTEAQLAGLTVGDLFPEGTVVRGPVARELTRLCESAGLSWSVQEGVLQVLPIGRALSRVAVELAPDSGLVGSPERGKGSAVKCKALLIPDLVPGRLVSLASEVIRGTFRIESAEYTGDTRGNEWYADLTLRSPRP